MLKIALQKVLFGDHNLALWMVKLCQEPIESLSLSLALMTQGGQVGDGKNVTHMKGSQCASVAK